MFKISPDIFFFKKRVLNQICGFFQIFLALYEIFTTLYNDLCIKFDLFDRFLYIETLYKRIFFENVLKGPF